MKITRNSARCTACEVEIVSAHVHDFVTHWCKVEPAQGLKWEGEGRDAKLVPSGKIDFRFAIDGGNEYIRQLGSGFTDTSEYKET